MSYQRKDESGELASTDIIAGIISLAAPGIVFAPAIRLYMKHAICAVSENSVAFVFMFTTFSLWLTTSCLMAYIINKATKKRFQ